MLATFLMYLAEFQNDCLTKYNSDEPNLILDIFEKRIDGIFSFQECLSFGAAIREEWEDNNKLVVSDAPKDQVYQDLLRKTVAKKLFGENANKEEGIQRKYVSVRI